MTWIKGLTIGIHIMIINSWSEIRRRFLLRSIGFLIWPLQGRERVRALDDPTEREEGAACEDGGAPRMWVPFAVLADGEAPLLPQRRGFWNGCFWRVGVGDFGGGRLRRVGVMDFGGFLHLQRSVIWRRRRRRRHVFSRFGILHFWHRKIWLWRGYKFLVIIKERKTRWWRKWREALTQDGWGFWVLSFDRGEEENVKGGWGFDAFLLLGFWCLPFVLDTISLPASTWKWRAVKLLELIQEALVRVQLGPFVHWLKK